MSLKYGPSPEPLRRFDPSENSFAVHQRVRVAIDRLNSTDKIAEMCNQVFEVQRFRGGLVFEAHRLLYHSA